MLINEKNIMLEAGVKMGLKAKLSHNRVVVTVDVSVNSVHPLEYLPNHARD
jgi:hypothetical protein